jgi:hypothetical protein
MDLCKNLLVLDFRQAYKFVEEIKVSLKNVSAGGLLVPEGIICPVV